METQYLFLIPLTPKEYLTENRKKLTKIALQSLIDQTYPHWKAILIGEKCESNPSDDRFIYIEVEGKKEEKLQFATDYIIESGLKVDYLIRLDDDDLFSTTTLKSLGQPDADVIVDKHHYFYNPLDNRVAKKVCYWFPNTCIIKINIALKFWGSFPSGDFIWHRENARLIENEHNKFHEYFRNSEKIIFADKNHPIYLRVLNPDSISAHDSQFNDYLDGFGVWTKDIPNGFETNALKVSDFVKHHQSIFLRVKNRIWNIIALRNYNKVVLNK